MTNDNQIILGIDPGISRVGFGVVIKQGAKLECLTYGCLPIKQKKLSDRLLEINQGLNDLIDQYHPQIAGVEELFFYNNQKTAIAVGQARGVIIYSLVKRGLLVKEFTPLQVKNYLTGYGQAAKPQIQQAVKLILKLKELPKPDDAADALAIALCASQKSYL